MEKPALEPIKLEPKLMPRVWGGRRLAERFGLQADEPIGEAWMVFDENRIASGPYAGRVLAEVLPELGEAFLGRALVQQCGYRLPLMVKFLDTADWLSVQVHPDDAYARAHEAESGWLGKAEAWVVLEAEPDAQVVYGVKRPISRDELHAAALDGSILELLNFVPVQKGDVIYVPPGTIHALGPGLLVYEVSQRSDLTYRLYDFGRGRELHLDKALDVVRVGPTTSLIDNWHDNSEYRFAKFNLRIANGTVSSEKTALIVTDIHGMREAFLLPAVVGAQVECSLCAANSLEIDDG